MVKIKRKVEVTQEEYAKYMIDKYGVSGFESSLIDDNIIDAPKRLTLVFELNSVSKSDLFNGSFRNGKLSVEVEEEITEDTVIDEMLTIYKNGVTHITNDKSLNYLDKTNLKSAYYMNDDLRLILIWRDGKLVE